MVQIVADSRAARALARHEAGERLELMGFDVVEPADAERLPDGMLRLSAGADRLVALLALRAAVAETHSLGLIWIDSRAALELPEDVADASGAVLAEALGLAGMGKPLQPQLSPENVVLLGPSGVGKSSLLFATVARGLRALPEAPLVVVFSSWGGDPAEELAAAVAELAGIDADGLVDTLEQAQAGRDVYLILDQAEEYFTYHESPGRFEAALAAILNRPLRVNVLLSLRGTRSRASTGSSPTSRSSSPTCCVSTASIAGIWAVPNDAAYCASKAGVIMLTKCLALDGAKAGIRANCVCPGFTETPMIEGYFADQPDPAAARRFAESIHPIGRLGVPRDIADAFVYLASDEASWVTGSSLVVDGGLTSGIWSG